MFVVIKLGGCNGSGKTSVARAIIDLIGAAGPAGHALPKAKTYYRGVSPNDGIETHVLGSYAKTCGGMDTISDKEDRFELVSEHSKQHHIIFFEGLITGKTYGALGQLSEMHVNGFGRNRGVWLYAFMDTPFEECVRRTEQRRAEAAAAKGTVPKPLDPERTLRPTFNSCQHLLEKLRGTRQARVGPQPYPHPTMLLDHRKKPATLARQLLVRAEELYRAG